MSIFVQLIEHSLALPFFGIGMKTDIFQSCGHWWVFQICWHIECSTFIASSFRIWNSSAGIPSPPLAFFIVMLPKAQLTSHSRMSGYRWVITPSSLSGSWSSFLFISSVFSWQNSVSLCPASFCTPGPNFPVTPCISWLPTFAFQSPIMKRTSFFWMLVLEGL